MTEKQATELLTATWTAEWATLHPTDAPYAIENEQFRGTTATWALVFFRHTTSRQITHGPPGSRKWERRGNILVFLFGDVDKGRASVGELVDHVRTVYEGKRLATAGDPLWIEAAGSQESGPAGKTTDGRWYMTRVVLPFRYFEIR